MAASREASSIQPRLLGHVEGGDGEAGLRLRHAAAYFGFHRG